MTHWSKILKSRLFKKVKAHVVDGFPIGGTPSQTHFVPHDASSQHRVLRLSSQGILVTAYKKCPDLVRRRAGEARHQLIELGIVAADSKKVWLVNENS